MTDRENPSQTMRLLASKPAAAMTEDDIVEKADRAVREATRALVSREPGYNAKRRAAEQEVRKQFRKDLEVLHSFVGDGMGGFDHGVPQAKLDLIWDWSWAEGHSEGYYRVAAIYGELAPLLK